MILFWIFIVLLAGGLLLASLRNMILAPLAVVIVGIAGLISGSWAMGLVVIALGIWAAHLTIAGKSVKVINRMVAASLVLMAIAAIMSPRDIDLRKYFETPADAQLGTPSNPFVGSQNNTDPVLGEVKSWQDLLAAGADKPWYQKCLSDRNGTTWTKVQEYADAEKKGGVFVHKIIVENSTVSDGDALKALNNAGYNLRSDTPVERVASLDNTRALELDACSPWSDPRSQVRVALVAPQKTQADVAKARSLVLTMCSNPLGEQSVVVTTTSSSTTSTTVSGSTTTTTGPSSSTTTTTPGTTSTTARVTTTTQRSTTTTRPPSTTTTVPVTTTSTMHPPISIDCQLNPNNPGCPTPPVGQPPQNNSTSGVNTGPTPGASAVEPTPSATGPTPVTGTPTPAPVDPSTGGPPSYDSGSGSGSGTPGESVCGAACSGGGPTPAAPGTPPVVNSDNHTSDPGGF